MTDLYILIAVVLVLSVCGGMYQAIRGPTPGDRLLVLQFLGTGAVAVLILTGAATHAPALVDIALVLALLTAITMVAFARLSWAAVDDARD